MLPEDLGDDGHGRVYWVRNNKDECLRRGRRDAGSEIADDSSVDLPKSVNNISSGATCMQRTLNKSSLNHVHVRFRKSRPSM